MNNLLRDLHFGLRDMARHRGFTILAVSMLAIALGATTAIFSVVNGILLRPLPYPSPNSLMLITSGSETEEGAESSYLNSDDLSKQAKSFDGIAAFDTSRSFLYAGEEPILISGIETRASLLHVLGVKPVLGRDLTAADDQPNAAPVVLIGHALFVSRFGSDPRILNSTIRLGSAGKPKTVIGVLPAGFEFPPGRAVDYLRPLTPILSEGERKSRGAVFLNVIGRLKPNVTREAAQAEVTVIARRLEAEYAKADTGLRFHVQPPHDVMVRKVRTGLLLLFGGVVGVLLIGCANVANLLLARAAGRGREIAIRTAVGATRGRIIAQLLAESVLLSVFSGCVGLLLASWGVRELVAFAPAAIPRVASIGLDAPVLLFALIVSVLTGVVFGLAPAVAASKTNLNEALKEGGRGSTDGRRGNRLRNVLVVGEIALSLVLLAGAGLLLRSFIAITGTEPGYDYRNVTTLRAAARAVAYDTDEKIAAFHQRVTDRFAAIPGVTSASAVDILPLSGGQLVYNFQVIGHQPFPLGQEPAVTKLEVMPGFFATMKIPLRQGRDFTRHDTLSTAKGVIVSETFVKKYMPGEQPIGKHLLIGDSGGEREIIGVAGDIRFLELTEAPEPTVYISALQQPVPSVTYIVRSELPAAQMQPAMRAALKEIDREQPVTAVGTFANTRAESLATRRFNMVLLSILAAVALLLAAAGIYSIMSYNVTQRTSEIGIRMALGAEARDIFRLIVGRAVKLALTGIILGAVIALMASRVMRSLLYDVAPTDPSTFIAICVILSAVALLASYIPARRAARVDPLVAIRYD
jgi:putative ABC transport system permease protein